VASLVFVIALGGGLLLLPFANTQGIITPPIVAYFTAISAVTTTGLTLELTATYWAPFGRDKASKRPIIVMSPTDNSQLNLVGPV
jgi:Trk-type K+ transport system membrane component